MYDVSKYWRFQFITDETAEITIKGPEIVACLPEDVDNFCPRKK